MTTLRPWLAALAALALLVPSALAQEAPRSPTPRPVRLPVRVTDVVRGLEHPWGLAFLPGGGMLVTERPGRLRLCSQYPFGLFEVWSWINPEFAALVYPRLEANPPPLPRHGAPAQREVERSGGGELAALRTYQTGDPPRNIAWKASARRDELLVKEFESPRGFEVVLDYASLRGLTHEDRLARLAAWVCMAEAARQPYALNLPQARIEAALGPEHRHACLRALALAPGAAP